MVSGFFRPISLKVIRQQLILKETMTISKDGMAQKSLEGVKRASKARQLGDLRRSWEGLKGSWDGTLGSREEFGVCSYTC